MAFKRTEWEYSNEVEKANIPVEEGLRYVKIVNATFDSASKEYDLTVDDLTNSAEFTLRYWLNGTDKNGNIISNASARGTLISLGKALAGEPIGIPAPEDVIGGVVVAEVVMKETQTGSRFPRVYKFTAASEEVVRDHSDIEQYSE